MKLREYQEKDKQAAREAFASGSKRILLAAPTGGGKTVIAANIINLAKEKGKRIWFLCDNTELVQQSVETFESFGMDVGVIQGQHDKTDYTKTIQVCTPQTLTRRWDRFDNNKQWLPDLIIIDEAHVVYKGHKEIMGMLPNTPVIGLSATPYAKGLGKIYDTLVSNTTTRSLIDAGFLSKSVVYSAGIPNLSKVKTKSNGDWQEEALAKTYNNKEITGDIVRTWLRLGERRQTLVFCITVQHSIDVANAFCDAGIPAGHVDGYTHKGLRENIISEYKSGDLNIVCNVGVLTKGFDAPNTGCVILARPTKSKMLHYQIMGRGLRVAENKEDCIFLDHAGNVERLGFPEDNEPEKLCDGERGNKNDRQEEPVETKKCPKCTQVLKVKAKYCACGHEFEFKEKVAQIEVKPGELKLLTQTQKKKIKETSPRLQQEFYSGMLQHQIDKGYRDGYAFYKFRDYFGVDVPAKFHDNPMPKNIIVEKYIKYLNIKGSYARRRRG